MTESEIYELREGVRSSLVTLRDVAGVAGSFVCSQNGQLLAREMPAVFEDGVLGEAGSRLLRMGETFAANGDEMEVAVVRYGDHRVLLRWISGGLLCVVIAGRVNMAALRMAANLVCRRISAAVAQAQAALAASPAESAPADRPPREGAPSLPSARGFPGMRRFGARPAE